MRCKKKVIIILAILISVLTGIVIFCSNKTTKNEKNVITSDGVCSDEVYNDISKAMNTVLFSEDYNNLSLNEKKERMLTALYELEDEGLILKDSIFYEDGTICFQYPDGFEGNVRLEDRPSGFSGNADTNKYDTSWKNSCNDKGAMPKIDFLDSNYPFTEENIKKLNLSAKYMFGLCDENDTSSKGYNDFHRFLTYYKTNQENWNRQYLKTDIDEYCTVEDFKTGLLGYDIVFIELHGTIYKKQPIICTYEEFNNDKYRNDRSHLIIDKDSNGKDYFLIKPSFFEKYYGNNKLNDSIIWIGSCHGYQYDDLAKAFENCGVNAVIGYNESVLTDYDYALHNGFVYSLMHGDTVSGALKFSKGYWKSSDKEWYYAINSSNKKFFNLIKDYDITLKKSAEAKVNFNGLNAKLIKLVEDKTNEDRLVQMIIYIMEEGDASKLIKDKEVEIAVSNSNIKCVNTKAKTNKEGIVMFEFNTNIQDLVAKTDITLHIEGYKDFTISNYGINTQGNIVNEAEAFMNPVESTATPTEPKITAIDLIDKTIPEIISLMNGEYQIIQTEMGGYYDGHYDGIFYIQNQSVFPGMEFYVETVLNEYIDCNYVETNDEIHSEDLRRNLESGKYALDGIQVNKSGKVDNSISADMDYIECSKVLGDFDCTGGSGGLIGGSMQCGAYTYNVDNTKITLHFGFNQNLMRALSENKGNFISSEQVKSYNPKLLNAVIVKNVETSTKPTASTESEIPAIDLKVETGKLTDNDIKPECQHVISLDFEYPIFKTSDNSLKEFLDTSVTNKILSYMATDSDYNLFIGGGFEYDMSIDGYLSIDGWVTNHAEYGNGYYGCENYTFFVDLKNRKILSLKDLFSESKDLVYNEIREKAHNYSDKNVVWESSLSNYDYENCKFLLNKDKLTLIFSPYEVSTGAAGTVEIEIPVSDINLTWAISGF